jgi:hypothetical protein
MSPEQKKNFKVVSKFRDGTARRFYIMFAEHPLHYVCGAPFTQFYIFDIISVCSNFIHFSVAVNLKLYVMK